MTELRTPTYVLRSNIVHDDRPVVVSFHYWDPSPGLEGEVFGESFFIKRQINWIGLKPATNDWYQGEDMPMFLDKIRELAGDRPVVTYGGSMGGYASVNFSEALNAQFVLAIAPQFSINPARANSDRRWPEDSARITFRHDQIDQIRPVPAGMLCYSSERHEGEQAGYIRASHPALYPVVVPFSGHQPGWILNEVGLLSALVESASQLRIPAPPARDRLRASRSKSMTYLTELSNWLMKRGRADQALCLWDERAAAWMQQSWKGAHQRFLCLMALGRHAEAAASMEVFLQHPEHAPAAQWYHQDALKRV